ncbi:SDR family oxidoreductase [Methylotenera sp.]|uniref:dTDP-4-dehydrorhamnose reductase family protein n=1 Tax=Methylotenera sp. TaxID=2051956 RepID=UPI002732F39E|nr:SDR family oxidoreductase [Methylotenera sp.]MDP3776377.1 SDR family oxidoreductase [Methylotenera sp.]
MKVLVLGSSGLIGSTTLRVLSERSDWHVYGSIRSDSIRPFLPKISADKLISNLDVDNFSSIIQTINEIRPDVVINCIGATKHKKEGNSPLNAIALNALLPHRLAQVCTLAGSRFIHISTDCVFSGKDGFYSESAFADADDVYGRSKALGEVNYGGALTLRTSTIGHELQSNYGLLNWFLTQKSSCKGFNKAIFSGLPTVVFAQVIRDIVLKNTQLSGLYNVAAQPINKYDLLKMIAKVYKKVINIEADSSLIIDRSLDASKFNQATGYNPPTWQNLIETMYQYQ